MYRYVLLIFLLVAWFALRIEHLFELFLVCKMQWSEPKKRVRKPGLFLRGTKQTGNAQRLKEGANLHVTGVNCFASIGFSALVIDV
jgi:hypothetical protein